jgi:hypothetical protein
VQGIQGVQGSSYAAPTLGQTPLTSGTTVSGVQGLTLQNTILQGTLTAGGVTGTSGYLLTSTGTGVQWAPAPVSLPSQIGNAGEFLTTNGTTASWSTLPLASGSNAGAVFGFASVNSSNTGLGFNALVNTGTYVYNNTAIGYLSGASNRTGTDNTFIGYLSGINSISSGSYNIVIGSGATQSSTTVSGEITLGDSNITAFRIPALGISWTTTSYPVTTIASAANTGIAGTPATARPKLTFIGATITDDSANNQTTVTITSSSGGNSEINTIMGVY